MPNNNDANMNARKEINNEFYTTALLVKDVLDPFLEKFPTLFKDKVILLPFGDNISSEWTLYFLRHFDTIQPRKIICIDFAPVCKVVKGRNETNSDLISEYKLMKAANELENSRFWYIDKNDSMPCNGSITIITKENYKSILEQAQNVPGIKRVKETKHLNNIGDFRGNDDIWNEADWVVSNPPFDIQDEVVLRCVDFNIKYILVGKNNTFTNTKLIALRLSGKLRSGHLTNWATPFLCPQQGNKGVFYEDGKRYFRVPITLITNQEGMSRIYHPTKRLNEINNPELRMADNFNALNVPRLELIPIDYEGVMCIPGTAAQILDYENDFDYLASNGIRTEDLYALKNGREYPSKMDKYLKNGTWVSVGHPCINNVCMFYKTLNDLPDGTRAFYDKERDGYVSEKQTRIFIKWKCDKIKKISK